MRRSHAVRDGPDPLGHSPLLSPPSPPPSSSSSSSTHPSANRPSVRSPRTWLLLLAAALVLLLLRAWWGGQGVAEPPAYGSAQSSTAIESVEAEIRDLEAQLQRARGRAVQILLRQEASEVSDGLRRLQASFPDLLPSDRAAATRLGPGASTAAGNAVNGNSQPQKGEGPHTDGRAGGGVGGSVPKAAVDAAKKLSTLTSGVDATGTVAAAIEAAAAAEKASTFRLSTYSEEAFADLPEGAVEKVQPALATGVLIHGRAWEIGLKPIPSPLLEVRGKLRGSISLLPFLFSRHIYIHSRCATSPFDPHVSTSPLAKSQPYPILRFASWVIQRRGRFTRTVPPSCS